MKPVFETSYMGYWIKVFPSRLEFKVGAGSASVPLNRIASIHTGMWGYMQIIIETTGGKKYKIPCSQKKEVQEAVYQAQDKLANSQGGSASVADELEKLNKLKKQGVLTDKEFEEQKKKMLG